MEEKQCIRCFEEKRKLSMNLERLPKNKLEQIVQIIKTRIPANSII